jgi:perosamine synthetase
MIDLFMPQMQPWFDDSEAQAVFDYMRSGGWLTEFKESKKFADNIADFTGARYCSVLSNGTVSLVASLLALNINHSDEVIVPAYTMVATANAVLMAQGAKVVFADVEPSTMGLDFESMCSKITDRTKAIMLVSINGRYPSRLMDILEFCSERGIHVIEDAAQALGSFHQGRHVGRNGLVGSFSFSMPKIITTGQGGALITDSEELYEKIEFVKNFGREQAGVDKHVFIGGNFKFTDLQAVVGIQQLGKIHGRMERKKHVYKVLCEQLNDIERLSFFPTSEEVTPWFNDVLVDGRKEFQEYLHERNIGTRPFYPDVPSQAPYKQPSGQFPNAEHLSEHGVWLPSYSQITDEELDRLIRTIRSFFQLSQR